MCCSFKMPFFQPDFVPIPDCLPGLYTHRFHRVGKLPHRTDGWLKMLKDLKKSHVMTAVEKEQSVWLGEFPFLIHVHTIARWWLQICVYFHSYLGKDFKFDYSI